MGKCINCGIDLQDGILCSECLNKTDDAIAKAEVNLVFTSGTLCMFSNRLEFQTKNAKKDKTILFAEIQNIEITMKNLIGFTYKNEKYDSFAFENEKIAQKWYETLKELIALHQKIVPDEEPEKEPKLIIVQERTKESKLEEVDQELVEESSVEETTPAEEKDAPEEKGGVGVPLLWVLGSGLVVYLSVFHDFFGNLSGFTAIIGAIVLTSAFMVLALRMGVDPGVIGQALDDAKKRQDADEEIRRAHKIWKQEERKYNRRWKNTKK